MLTMAMNSKRDPQRAANDTPSDAQRVVDRVIRNIRAQLTDPMVQECAGIWKDHAAAKFALTPRAEDFQL